MRKRELIFGAAVGIAALLSGGCCNIRKQEGSVQQQSQPVANSNPVAAPAPAPVAAPPPAPVPEVIQATFDSGTIAGGVRRALGEPSRFNWESVVVTSLDVSGGAIQTEVTRLGSDRVSARVHGDNIFTVIGKGHGDRETLLNVSFTLNDVDAQLSFASRQADVEATARIVGHGGCRVWTRYKKVVSYTMRLTAEPQTFDVQIKVRLRMKVQDDGTVVLTPLGWSPISKEQTIDVKMIGQKLPGGWARINPLDAETMRVEFGMPGQIGDRTVGNPIREALGKVMNRDFPVGKLP